MLKIKTFFFYLFLIICLGFTSIFYFINESYINNIIKNTYEQKLKSLDDVLRFSILQNLNEKNIKNFASQTRADFVIKKDGKIFSSLQNFDFFKNKFDYNTTNDFLEKKEIFYKAYEFEKYQYIIIVYPKLSNQIKYYWINNAFIFILFIIILALIAIFIFYIFKWYFKDLLFFIKNINNESDFVFKKTFFKDLNFLNSKILKIKELYLKQDIRAKKQAKKIKMKNSQLNNIISTISHELKNPLSVIDISLESLKNENDEKTKEFLLHKIQKQSFKINNLTHKLNLVFNLNSNSLNLEIFDLFEISKELANSFNEERIKIYGETTLIKADLFLIEQVIINLISNALKYSKNEIIIKVYDKEFTIEDKGIGIEAKHIKSITKKFYKINNKTNNSFGLGLFLVKKILSLHQSHLNIKSIPNQGSIFSFKINLTL
ncbi:HAMP domain-containing sensor histidine kinase [Campylobacter sp. CCS1377]|uniref:histidine kinase n=1 Tax=Campylobacter sp. CCS1377 TaxID=3158229 RepID=A0AAU7E5U8_9BACT